MKTFEQAKDEVAKNLKYTDWYQLVNKCFRVEDYEMLDSCYNAVYSLYANSKAAKAWEESKEVNSIQFATWYSGMRKEQVELQYKRYLREFNHQPTNPYK